MLKNKNMKTDRTLPDPIKAWDYYLNIAMLLGIGYSIILVNKYRNFINFIKQPLALWMFIPCAKLEKPKGYDFWLKNVGSAKGIDREPGLTHVKLYLDYQERNGKPLEKPENYDVTEFNYLTYKEQNDWLKESEQYQQALERVIFDGFEIQFTCELGIHIANGKELLSFDLETGGNITYGIDTISDLCNLVQLKEEIWNKLKLG